MTYKPPVRDLMFALDEAADFGALAKLFPGVDAETASAKARGFMPASWSVGTCATALRRA